MCLLPLLPLPLPSPSSSSYGQDGSVFEDHLYDVYLSYFQRTTTSLALMQHKPHSPSSSLPPSDQWADTAYPVPYPGSISTSAPGPQLPPNPPSVPPPPFPPAPAPPSPQVIVADRRHQTIYDAELKLLLGPPPDTAAQAKRLLAAFPPFQHGSFLLYGQRGLTETYPLEYTCCSVSGSASVQEPVYRSLHSDSLSSPSPVTSTTAKSAATSGYFYPTSTPRHTPRVSPASPVSCRMLRMHPNELTNSTMTPKELVMYIDVLQSGKVYSAVLRFNHPVYLTDMCVATNSSMGCVSVDVWGEGGEGEAVRLAQSTEIQEKNLMLGNLMPPPLCQFVKVRQTYIVQSLTCTHSLSYSFTTQALTHTCTYTHTHTHTLSLTQALTHPHTHSLTHSHNI